MFDWVFTASVDVDLEKLLKKRKPKKINTEANIIIIKYFIILLILTTVTLNIIFLLCPYIKIYARGKKIWMKNLKYLETKIFLIYYRYERYNKTKEWKICLV